MNKIYKNLRYRRLEWKATRLPWESETDETLHGADVFCAKA